jgi:hypothetical protein
MDMPPTTAKGPLPAKVTSDGAARVWNPATSAMPLATNVRRCQHRQGAKSRHSPLIPPSTDVVWRLNMPAYYTAPVEPVGSSLAHSDSR